MELILFNKRYNKDFCELVVDLINKNKNNPINNHFKTCNIVEFQFIENIPKNISYFDIYNSIKDDMINNIQRNIVELNNKKLNKEIDNTNDIINNIYNNCFHVINYTIEKYSKNNSVFNRHHDDNITLHNNKPHRNLYTFIYFLNTSKEDVINVYFLNEKEIFNPQQGYCLLIPSNYLYSFEIPIPKNDIYIINSNVIISL